VRPALVLAAIALAFGAAGDQSADLGRSVRGRAIRVVRIGPADAPRTVLVVGSIHGNETAGEAVTRRLRGVRPPHGVALWLIDDLNPDGSAAHTRQNAHRVDLNRNFPYRWHPGGPGLHYPGPRPLSEPESRAVAKLVKRIRPLASVWYHQALALVTGQGGDPRLQRLYAQRSGLPRRRLANYRGTAISWENHRDPGSTAFVVELPPGRLSRAATDRHARAVLAVARAVGGTARASAIAPRPRIVQRSIPFPRKRKREMRLYARRHYGIDDFRLRSPHVIVEHYTDGDTFASAYNTFARDVPDVELHELPGVCSHYVVDKDGTIYQLVPTRLMCRHTVGLNYTAIGIEHVGRSDAQILGNRRQLRSSVRLTRYLQGRFGIKTRNVIGHNESLSSPYHHERVPRLRHQTHGDWRRSSMQRYRRALRR
jgi:N-acetylmuramoyl-L-alanine amidase-like protein/zinc carboxypeptidase